MSAMNWLPAEIMGFASTDVIALMNVIMIDLVLAGDNAIVVGLAASAVAPELRKKVIFWGMAGAVLLRIFFAVTVTQLMDKGGFLPLAGGILLLWVCWKMYREIVNPTQEIDAVEAMSGGGVSSGAATGAAASMSLGAAIWSVVLADVSMSLDNVLAVAGAAKGNTVILVIGLAVAVLMMAIAANYIAKLLVKYPWITWVGLAIILYIALDMIWRGSHQVACEAWDGFWCKNDLIDLIKVKAGI